MKTKRRPRKTFSKVLSVVLCFTILLSTYAGFFSGFGAAAGKALDINTATLHDGEVAVTKGAVQDDRSADITVNLAAKPGVLNSSSTVVVEKPVDLIMIIDCSNSMTKHSSSDSISGGTLYDDAIYAAKEVARELFALNSNNRVAVGSFHKDAYGYKLNGNNATSVLYANMNVDESYFATNYNDAAKLLEATTRDSGTNTEGGYLVANKLVDYANSSANADRQKVVLVMTDGLPQDRYTDNFSKAQDNETNYYAMPSYLELYELVVEAQKLASKQNTLTELVFFTGGLTQYNRFNTEYYVGAEKKTETVRASKFANPTMADRIANMNDMHELMSIFFGVKTAPDGAKAIGDLLAEFSASGETQYPTNATQLLAAFKSVINTIISSQELSPAVNAVYTDIIPEHYDVDENSISVSMGSAKVLHDQQVTIDGVTVTRDVVEWTIGTIPEEVQNLSYTINVNDPKLYGILNVAEQGILTYDETAGTVTESPLILQIDEIILAPKGADDYYIFKQGESLNASNQGVAGVLVNDDILNTLLDESGNAYDSKSIVNGNIAGLDGTQASLKLEDYTAELVSDAKYGQLVLNEDGTFTYVPDASLYEQPTVNFDIDPNGTNAYNYSGTVGWEDTFTYKLKTEGTGGSVTVTTVTPIDAPELSLVVFENMTQEGADVEGAAAIGGDLTVIGGWSVGDRTDGQGGYNLVVGGDIIGLENINFLKNSTYIYNEQWVRDYVAKLRAFYTALSAQYKEMPADGSYAWGTFTANPNHVAGTPHVFNVGATEDLYQANFTGTFGDDPIIINVGGTSRTFNGGQYGMFQNTDLQIGDLYKRVIWNFYEMEEMSSSSMSFHGCVLAPKASYSAQNGHVNGTLIVRELHGFGGFEYHMVGSDFNQSIGDITIDTEVSTETTDTNMENYVVTGNEEVKVSDALESEEITVHIRVLPNLSELTADKDSNPASGTLVKPGDEIEYTISVYNPCSVPVTNVVVNDSAPFGTTITDANGGDVDGRNISFTIDKIGAGKTAEVKFTVTVNDEITGTNNLANTANVVYTLPGEDTPDSSTTDTVNHAVLTAEKASSVPANTILAAGDEITYTIAVTNRGTAAANDVQVVDTLPDGVTYKSGSVDVNGNTVSTTIKTIAAGETATVTFTVTVNAIGTGSKVIENTATVNGEPTNTTENITKYGSVVVKYVDEAGNEIHERANATGKTGSEYGPYPAVDIENYKPIRTEGNPVGTFTEGEIVIVHVYAKIPGFAVIKYVDEKGNSIYPSVTENGWQGDTLTDLRQEEIDRYEYVRTDAPTTTLTEEGITIIHVYKLIPDSSVPTVGKTASPADGSLVVANDKIVYTISVTNNKYEAMSKVVVTDTAPKGTTITDAGNGTVNGNTISFVIPTIEAGATATVSFTVTVDASISGTDNLANTAYVTYKDRESTIENTIPTNTTGHAILTAVKAGGDAAFYGPGDIYTYNITVTNNGTAAAQNIVVTDTVPAGVTLFNAKTAAVNGDVLTWNIDKLEAGASKTVSFEVMVNDTTEFISTISNTAYVNDIPTNETEDIVKKGTVDVQFVDEAGNTLADALHYEGKTGTAHGDTSAIDIYGYELKYTNGTTDGNFTDGNITIVHVYERLTGTVTIQYIDQNSGHNIDTTVTDSGWVGDAIESDHWKEITNYTYVSTTKPSEMKYVEGNVDIIHYYTFIEADDTPLTLEKVSDPISGTTVRYGEEITYIITLNNTRVDPINNVVIEDYIPDGMSFVSASTGAEFDAGKLTWNVGTIPAGASKTVYFTAMVNDELTGYGNLRNVASATFSNRDLEPENPIYSNEVTHPIISAILESFTDQPKANLTEGDKITYKITVTNEGSVGVTNVPVIADIPDGTTFVSSEDGKPEGGNFVTTIPSLEPGEVVELYYTVVIDQLPDGVYEIDIPNIANVDGVDTNDVLDKAYVGILVVKYLDYDGSELCQTTVERARVGTAYGSLPIKEFENREFNYVDGSRVGNYIRGTITVVFHYNLIPATLTVKYIDKDTGVEIKNVDVYTGFNQGDVIPGTYAEQVDIPGYIYNSVVTPDPMKFVTPTAEIIHYYVRVLDTDEPTVEKISNPASGELVKGGDTITYSIAVTNVRETDALENVVVTDAVPAGTTVNSIANEGVENNGVITWNIGSIAAGQTKIVSFTVTVDSGLTDGSNLGNVAYVNYRDIQKGEDKVIPTNPTSHALLTSNKTSSVPAGAILYAGDIISYNVNVTNIGTAPAYDVEVYDTVPNGTGLILSTLTNGASVNGGKISYVIKNLQPGETKTLSFSVQVLQLADGEYAKVITNTAVVDGDNTNTTEDLVKRGTLTVKYQDTAGNTLADDIVTTGAVDTKFTLPAEKKFENLRLQKVTRDSDSETYIEGNITYIYIYERIPATAIVKYLDINSKATLLTSKTFESYVGETLESDYYENITHYNYVTTDRPTKLVYTEEGLVIIHYYEYIFDNASIEREKVASPASGSLVKMGDEITYTINVKNPRYDDITNVVVTDAVPAGSTFVSADNGGTEAGGTVTWNLGTLAAGQSAAVSFTVKVNDQFAAPGNLHNLAQITYTGAGENEPTTVVTNDTYHAVLTYDKQVDADAANTMDVLTYTITVKNEGSIKAENITVTDTVPANTTLVEGSYGKAEYSFGTLTWTIAKLESGESANLTFKVKVDVMDSTEFREIIANKAKVNGDETNEVNTIVTQGTVVVTHVTVDGIELKPEEVATGNVGDSFSFSEIDSPVYKLKEVNGQPNDVFVEGVKYVEFVYELREAGLIVNYLEYGTEKVLDASVTETYKVNDKVNDIYKQEFITLGEDLYEFVTTTYEPDNSLVMTKDGIVVNHYYELVPTGDVVVKHVDTAGSEIAERDSSSGNIYETYSYEPKDIDGYIFSYVAEGSDPESANYPANDTNEIVYVYVRATGTLVVRYLELGTDKVLADNVSEVYNTGDTVTDLHEKVVDKYDYNSSVIPSSLVMTEDGLEIIHYYTLTPTGTATAHYVDREGNDLLDQVVKGGTIYESYTFTDQPVEGWHLVEVQGEETGKFPADSNNDVYYIYERDTGVLTVFYRDIDNPEGTLSSTYTDVYNTGDKVEDVFKRDVDLYEFVQTDAPADMTMTTAGITITHWYKIIPTGDAIAKFVDVEGNELHTPITAAGNIYETYNFDAIDIPGYKLVEVQGVEEGNYPAYSTAEVIYVYERCVGNLTVNYLEQGTGLILAEQYNEVIPTLVEVTDLHEKTIAYYDLVEKDIPENLVMTEDGIVINYYYALVATGTVTVNYVDEDYNPLILPETVSGVVDTEFAFTPETIDGYVYSKTEGEPEGVITEEPQEIFFIYTREKGVLNISYLEEGTDKVLADAYTETMDTGETVTDLRANSISGYVRVSTDRPESLVMTTDGIDIIHYYKVIPTGKVTVSHVDEEGNELIEGETVVDFVDVKFNYEPADIPGYELIEVEGEPEGAITEEDQDVKFIYRRLNGTLHITYIDKTTGEPVAESYNEVLEVGETVKDLKEKDVDGYTLVDKEIPEDLTMTEKGLDVVYYYTPDTYTVSGTTWIEGNKDSSFDKANDVCLSDIKVTLYDGAKTIVGTASTDRNGEFEIDGVKAGKYTVSFDVPSKYKVVDSLPYSATKTNSIANYTGDTGVLTVTGDTPNVGMGVEGIVLGSTATNEQEIVKPQTPQTVYTPTTSTQQNATYTKVLGDTGVNPSTGDTTGEGSGDLTVVAVMLAACSLFVLTLAKKKGATARR